MPKIWQTFSIAPLEFYEVFHFFDKGIVHSLIPEYWKKIFLFNTIE